MGLAMTRPARIDSPGTWHHLANRGIARRTLFETDRDIRTFLALVASEVRAREVEVHAYSIMTTHYHLLLRSTSGNLSRVMQRIQNRYSRWFNRARHRDGPLVRGRFMSRPVRSANYRNLLVRYIDANPVVAGLVAAPDAYPHGSATWYARPTGPIWLERSWVEGRVRDSDQSDRYEPASYPRVFGGDPKSARLRLIGDRIRLPDARSDPLDDLLGAAPPRVLEWMMRKSHLADGTDVGLPVCIAEDVDEVLAEARVREGSWVIRPTRRAACAWSQAHAGLLRSLCGLTLAEVGLRLGCSAAQVGVWESRHRHMLSLCDDYRRRTASLAHAALQRCASDFS